MVRKALIIANGTFDDPTIPPLKSPVTDGQRLKRLLEREDIGPYEVELHTDGNCQPLRGRIQRFFDDAASDDLVLLYVTGHGFKDRSGKLYFTTRDSEKQVLGATAIEARFFVERMQECAARTQIWFLDTCYAGAFARGVAFKGASAVTRDDFAGTMPEEEENDRPGRVVITASTAVEMAAEKEAGEERTVQSLFTRYLIEGIETGTPDRENSGVITLDSLFRHVRSKVQAETSRAQSPERWIFGGDGNIASTRNPVRRAELPSAVQKLMRSRSPNKRSDAVRALLELANGQDQQLGALAVAGLRTLSDDRDTVVEAVAKLALGKLGGARVQAQPQAPIVPAPPEAVVEPVAQPVERAEPVTAARRAEPEDATQGKVAATKDHQAETEAESRELEQETTDKRDPVEKAMAANLGFEVAKPAHVTKATDEHRFEQPVPSTPDSFSKRFARYKDKIGIKTAFALLLGVGVVVTLGVRDANPSTQDPTDPGYSDAVSPAATPSASDPAALNAEADQFRDGVGKQQDDVRAVKLYREAADLGYADAQSSLGFMYSAGRGVAKDDAQAVAWYRKAADQGYASAQFDLGFMYDNGRGVAKDVAQAAAWYRKAADQGYASAQFNLGVNYANGIGVTKDDAQAVAWYRKAADQGDASAQHNLGFMYENGRGVAEDDAQAVAWYRKAADQGVADAQKSLGWMYYEGRGVTKDDAQAVAWYRKAADQGNALGQVSLGVMYEKGRGVTKDDAQAVAWYRKSADQGNALGQSYLGDMYEYGRGVTKDEAKARQLYKQAMDNPNASADTKRFARRGLANLTERGDGI